MKNEKMANIFRNKIEAELELINIENFEEYTIYSNIS